VEAMCNRVVIINKGKIVANDKIENLQQKLVGEVLISVEFKNEINENLLKGLEGVLGVKQKGKRYIVRCKHDIRADISELASLHNWILISMNMEEDSLEQVFQKLTNNQ
jgi:ABC-2 type transport system ATP-binding protein